MILKSISKLFIVKVLSLVLFLNFPVLLLGQEIGKDGLTFQKRKAAYLSNLADPVESMSIQKRRRNLYGWLDKGIYNNIVASAITDLLGPIWLKGIRAHNVDLIMAINDHGNNGDNVIPNSMETTIRNKFDSFVTTGQCFQGINDQKQMYQMAGTYLYTLIYGDKTVPRYGLPDGAENTVHKQKAWPNFTYNGHSYVYNTVSYDARTISRDFIEWALDAWYVQKISPARQREFASQEYTRAFMLAMSAIVHLDPTGPFVTKAQMAADFMAVDYMMFEMQNGAQCSSLGRQDYKYTRRGSAWPIYQYFGLATLEDEERSGQNAAFFYDYRMPNILVDLFNWNDQNKSDWIWTEKYNNSPNIMKTGGGKWNFMTKNYCIGASKGHARTGWQVVIKANSASKTSYLRFWLNNVPLSNEFNPTEETSYLGDFGHQFQNSLYHDGEDGPGGTPVFWVRKRGGETWDDSTKIGDWHFMKEGDVMVTYARSGDNSCVEVVTAGVEHASYADFKAAVAANSTCGNNSFTNSRSQTINDDDEAGRLSPGDRDSSMPFNRLEAWDDNGNQVIDWDGNDVMTIKWRGRTATYDFGSWSSTQATDPLPDPPTAVEVRLRGMNKEEEE